MADWVAAGKKDRGSVGGRKKAEVKGGGWLPREKMEWREGKARGGRRSEKERLGLRGCRVQGAARTGAGPSVTKLRLFNWNIFRKRNAFSSRDSMH